MNIVMITPQWLRTLGGPTKTVFSLATEMRGLGHSVEVLTCEKGSGATIFDDRLFVRELQIIRHLLSADADIVHIHGSIHFVPAAWLYKNLCKPNAKIVVTLHTQPVFANYLPDSIPVKDPYRGFRRPIANGLLNRSDRVVSVSKSIVDNLIKHTRFNIPNYSVISSGGSPITTITNDLQKRGCPSPIVRPLLSTVGVFAWDWKVAGHALAIAAVRILRDEFPCVKLLIIGDGKYRGYLERCVNSLGVRAQVDLCGAISEPGNIVNASDVYVHMGLNEGSPLSLVEAMFAGKPIIAVDCGGIPELILHKKTGMLVEPTAKALADAVRDLLSNPTEASRISENARAFALEFLDWKVIANRYLELYSEI